MSASLNTADLEQRVKQMYREVAENPHQQFHFETGRALAERLGYPGAELDRIPAPAVDSFAGVGFYFDLARIVPGETVVDLGSGAGMDSFLAAGLVGATGRVIGIDMTTAQLEKSTRLAANFGNVEFRDSHIEDLPLDGASADVVISNGVINLSPDKHQVFTEAARVLRPGGRLAISDIVTERPLPDGVTCDAALWAACIGGAMQRDDYATAIENAGLRIETIRENTAYRFLSDQAAGATETYGVISVSILARRTP